MDKERVGRTALKVARAALPAAFAAANLGVSHPVSAETLTQQGPYTTIGEPWPQCGGTTDLENYPFGKVVMVLQAQAPNGEIIYINRLTDDNCSTETGRTQEVSPIAWPETPEAAASLFGATAARWRMIPSGWHLQESGNAVLINPQGYLAEGYFDTRRGGNARAFASAGLAVPVQGMTIWQEAGTPEAAADLQARMAIPVWDDRQPRPALVIATGAQASALLEEAQGTRLHPGL